MINKILTLYVTTQLPPDLHVTLDPCMKAKVGTFNKLEIY